MHAQEATPGLVHRGRASRSSSAEAAAGDTVELKLQQSGTGDTGVRPAVSYTPDGQDDVRDAAANFAPAATIAQATDGARPVLLSAATADVDNDGRLDRVATSWSEPLTHADDSASPFPVSAEQFAVTRLHAAVGQTLDVDLAEPAAPDTGSAPDITYAGGADPITDASGLEPAQKAYPGITRDAPRPAPGCDHHGRRRHGRQARRGRHRVERAGDGRHRHRALHGRRADARRKRELQQRDDARAVRRGPGAVRHRRDAERLLRRRPGRPARRGRGRGRHDLGRAERRHRDPARQGGSDPGGGQDRRHPSGGTSRTARSTPSSRPSPSRSRTRPTHSARSR